MSGLDDVREHMQVIDAEGTPLGKVDKIEGDRIKLTRDSSGSGSHEGHHHFIDTDVQLGRRGRRGFDSRRWRRLLRSGTRAGGQAQNSHAEQANFEHSSRHRYLPYRRSSA